MGLFRLPEVIYSQKWTEELCEEASQGTETQPQVT